MLTLFNTILLIVLIVICSKKKVEVKITDERKA